ncbi:Polyadenylate-binding protein-interacting protein 7 [Hibiscus syriacus]|uniref:Polyadenylate-binding protein-interacting protein 7 n=1 Tax=Hibiscus syriacus TaxID=106335 RepID=A0A6A2YDY4_HIBSY|nr:polyadenylate-binding protein-interacting protein 7-like [Hibiscus syriacus]KAE8677126.1 Polyadenylate-binding protein-interacting protein 7 [Hibiscus syriacus]
MSSSKKEIQISDTKLNTPSKVATLNPNAAEFVPVSLRSPSSGNSSAVDATRFAISRTIGKSVLDRSESSISNNSDDEAHQFWRRQLPDDITPDFKVINEDDSRGTGYGSLSLAGLSLHGGSEASSFPASVGGGYIFGNQKLLHHNVDGNKIAEELRLPDSSYGRNPTSASFLHFPAKPWDKQLVNSDQLLVNGREGQPYNGNSRHRFSNDLLGEHAIMDDPVMNPVEFLASQFPDLAAENLAEVYFANGCDLNLTIEMLNQLEPQVDGGFNPNLNSKTLSAPNLMSTLGFPAVTVSDDQNGPTKYAGDDLQHSAKPYQSSDKNKILMFKSSSSLPSGGALDFTSGIRKMTSPNSHGSANAYSAAPGRGFYANRLQIHGSAHSAPVWPETGDTVANLYSELWEESQVHARASNAYFDQVRQGFPIGNKALAKELSLKGPLQSMRMKATHGNAEESIYRQRNRVHPEVVGGQLRIIDLHGLHVTEAIHMLKYELSVLRSTARAVDQRLQVYIGVGAGHQTRGSRIPARLPVAIQHYLLEEECLDYTEPQPGLLRVVIY